MSAVRQHAAQEVNMPNQQIEVGLCRCGCGQRTKISTYTAERDGYIKGQPRLFCRGHHGAWRTYAVDQDSGCWNWLGAIGAYGRAGAVRRDGRTVRPYTFMYERAKGPVPKGLVLDHLCRNPNCVNPDHLEAVTVAVNTRRGRATKLTAEEVLLIRRLGRVVTHKMLSERFGVSQPQISRLINGRSWKEVGA